jgi:hypothetical protein
MLHKAKTINGYKLDGLDGEMGKVSEFYFDDHYWVVRYLVANTGTWLSGRHILLSPYALGAVSNEEHRVAVTLTKQQIEASPSLDSDKPVSRQFEASFYAYYGWPPYSVGAYMWGAYPYIARDPMKWAIDAAKEKEKTWDPHLRSTYDVGGHHVQAEDGDIGHVDDFVIDDENWAIRYLIIDTRNWWPGKRVLVAPQWIERVSWNESTVFVRLSRDAIQRSPEYTEESLLSRAYEDALHRHYNRRGYWDDEAKDRPQLR